MTCQAMKNRLPQTLNERPFYEDCEYGNLFLIEASSREVVYRVERVKGLKELKLIQNKIHVYVVICIVLSDQLIPFSTGLGTPHLA